MTANNARTRKAKGMKFQKYVVDRIRSVFGLSTKNVVSVPSGVPGADVILSEKAAKIFPYSIECKCRESISIWKSLEQSSQSNRDLTPLLVFKRNHSEVYCALKFEDFLYLLKKKKMCEDNLF